jgi:hypothetical protein
MIKSQNNPNFGENPLLCQIKTTQSAAGSNNWLLN